MATPRRRFHRLRGGDGPSIPAGKPPEMWPDLEDVQPYWDSFISFAISELESPMTFEIEVEDDGSWMMKAMEAPHRDRTGDLGTSPARRSQLLYDPEEDTIRFSDPDVGGWVMEDAFGGDPTGASSAL